VAPQDATAAGDLLKRADTALYQVKHEETGSFRFFAPAMHAAQQARSELEQDLRAAVRDEALALAWQPRYGLAADRLKGFEVLLRWPHPRHGKVEPDRFIPVAEETRLIVPIGAWVLRQACAEAARWPAPLHLAVNLSPVQFRNNDLAGTVREALAASGLPASRLELEVTVAVLQRDSEASLTVLSALADIGVGITLDNFGAGNSALSLLRRFPFARVKIARSFLRDLSPDPRSAAIVRAIASLGRDLGMAVTAMGVETEDQLDRVRQEGCTDAQGFLLGGPISSAEMKPLIERESKKEVLFLKK
jgi:predicted signal transduction protein with EAL and GGDEF domain